MPYPRNQLIPVPCIVSITLGTQRDGTRDNVHLPITGQLTCSPVDLHMSGQLTISWPRWTSYIWYLLLSLRRPRQSDIARARARIHFGNAGFARDLFASSAEEEKAWRRSRGSIRNVGSAKLVGFSSHRLPIHQPSVTSASTNANSCPSSCSDSSHSFVHSFGRALVHSLRRGRCALFELFSSRGKAICNLQFAGSLAASGFLPFCLQSTISSASDEFYSRFMFDYEDETEV